MTWCLGWFHTYDASGAIRKEPWGQTPWVGGRVAIHQSNPLGLFWGDMMLDYKI